MQRTAYLPADNNDFRIAPQEVWSDVRKNGGWEIDALIRLKGV
jgi:hypothetical protein